MKFSISASNVVPDQWRNFVLQYCEEQQARGVQFKDGETIGVGWMVFKLKSETDHFIIQAPKLGSMPMVFDDDCSNALQVAMTQKYMAESFGCPLTACNCLQSAIILKNLSREDGIFMNRQETEQGNDSGWFIGAQNSKLDPNDPKNLERKSLWEISRLFPETIEFWQLQVNWQVVFEPRPIVLCSFQKSRPVPRSYYATKYGLY